MAQQLFYSDINKSYTYVISDEMESVKCVSCNSEIELEEYFFIHKSYSKTEYIKEIFCHKCIKKHKTRIYDEFIVAQLLNDIPEDAKFIIDLPPQLRISCTTFEAALSNKQIKSNTDKTTVNDYTRYSGRESYEGVNIGYSQDERYKYLDEPVVDIDSFLIELKQAEKINSEGVKLIKCEDATTG